MRRKLIAVNSHDAFKLKTAQKMMKEDLISFLSTLIVNDFQFQSINRISKGSSIINASKTDKLGAKILYSILVNTANGSQSLVQNLLNTSRSLNSTPLIVSNSLYVDDCKTLSFEEFSSLIGGFVNTGLILIPSLVEIMDDLGYNKLPKGLEGQPDKLLEIYVKECLQYLMVSPVKRFGSNRAFESVPDGIVLGKNQFTILFDAKAYGDGFSFTADDIERFAKYVNDFNHRYQPYITVFYFLVVSGRFNDSETSIVNRSDALFNKCRAKISCVESGELAKIVKTVSKQPLRRNAMVWSNVLQNPVLTEKSTLQELKRIEKDQII